MSNSLPHAQKLYERFAGDDRVRIVAVATAFEKEEYPWMADEAKIRQALKQNGWEFPVMRDIEEEQIVRVLTLGRRTGTPMTLVVDTEGVVRWHDFNGTAETAKTVDETVERLLESFYVPAIEDLDPKLSAYAKGKYGTAWKAAKRIVDTDDVPDPLRAQAEAVLSNLDAGIARQITASTTRRERGFPIEALQNLEAAVKMFRGVPTVKDAEAAVSALKRDRDFAMEQKIEKELEKILRKLADPDAKRSPLAKKLTKLLENHRETPLGPRIQEALTRAE